MKNNKNKRIGATITFVLAFFVAAFVSSGVAYGAKPSPSTLNAPVCGRIGGVWTPNTCTIPAGTAGTVSSGFTIGNGVKLDIRGSLTIPKGLTVTNANSGTIIVENAGGVIPPSAPLPLHTWETGMLVLGTLANSGTITIENVGYDEINQRGTDGITVSASISATDWSDLSTYVAAPGALTNAGTITILNGAQTRGIENLGTIDNFASGTILVENSGIGSVGIYNKRSGGSELYLNGTLTNAGSITISSSGDSNLGVQYGYGIYNQGLFTISDNGTFTILPSPTSDDSRGLWNGGSFHNYGTVINDRGSYNDLDPTTATWGSYNEAGTMINYGTTYAKGTFYNNLIMLQYGTVTSSGTFDDRTGESMINYGTFYNSGLILGGKNRGICIDEKSTDGTTYIGNGCR